ncbi:MAG: ATP-binding protein [Bacteroidota bacterium]
MKSLFPNWSYFSMETPDIRQQVQNNPRELFVKYGHRLILDEVQRTPNILSYIQTIVDEDEDACFILSGSHNMLMLESISQSLAGRSAIFYLLPLSIEELRPSLPTDTPYESLLFKGGYPRIYHKDLLPPDFYPNYLETYVQRDVRQIKSVGNLSTFNRFLAICAGHIGQSINYSKLANAAGISLGTAKNWLSILETSFVVYQLNPYYRNFNKRITKSTKLYFYDTGLACSLLRLNQLSALDSYYQKGALFENFVINEVSKHYYNQGLRPPYYYWRDSNGNEIDLLLDLGGQLMPIEIKSSRTFSSRFFKNVEWWRNIATVPLTDSYVIYGGEQDWEAEFGRIISWRNLANHLPS